jgi:hypothetical protein
MKRLGVTNKSMLARFVMLANTLEIPITIGEHRSLKNDITFPKALTIAGPNHHGEVFTILKRDGMWQIQAIDEAGKPKGVTPWLPTKKMDDAMDFALMLYKNIKERDQVLA